MPRSPPDIEAKAANAALRLAANKGWKELTLDQIAKAAAIAPATLRRAFTGKNDILPAILRWIDGQATAALGKPDLHAVPHDRLFEAMMARFDILQQHRKAILAIARDCSRDPAIACLMIPAQIGCVRQMLAHAGLRPKGVQDSLAVAGLMGVYGRALWYWRKDTTSDMTPTMAAVDQSLRMAGKAAEILFRAR